ncbi:protein of unknown function [Candidatus Promineifilum breve]|uniref:Uncharacterized protein n=1 Tax=Candidatus Promineifilum breve TaxID=1806508 RepID=A0A160T3E5_9CHLR|nr:protein of unknown function [Candidatus Promineifilum breve]
MCFRFSNVIMATNSGDGITFGVAEKLTLYCCPIRGDDVYRPMRATKPLRRESSLGDGGGR